MTDVIRAVAALLVAAVWCGAPADVRAQAPRPPDTASVGVEAIAGEWFEAATTGSFALRRCVTDTRYRFEPRSARTLQVFTACATNRGAEYRRGFLSGSKTGDGRFSLRYAPVVLSWAPAAWTDFWVLDVGEGWLVAGDRRKRSLVVLSRTVALDESALAAAMAAARRQGYDPAVLHLVSHPSGATGLTAGR